MANSEYNDDDDDFVSLLRFTLPKNCYDFKQKKKLTFVEPKHHNQQQASTS